MPKLFQVYGVGQPLIPVLPPPIPFASVPTSVDTNFSIGQIVYTPVHNPTAFYMFGGGTNWIQFASNSGDVLAVNGTASQITASTTLGTVTLSIPSTFIAPGSVEVTSGFSVDAGTSTILGTVRINNSGIGVTTIGTGGTGATNIGNANGNTTVTGTLTTSAGITATTGNIAASSGNVSASGTVTGTGGVIATTGNVLATAGQVVAGGDTGGVASSTSLTNANSTTISTGVGSVKMSTTNAATNAAWVKIYVGTTAYWIPAWTTNAP